MSILEYIENKKTKMVELVMRYSRDKYATWWLAVVSFTESSFFILPPDVLLVPLVVASAQNAFKYARITTMYSVLGGIAGYLIGAFLFDIFGAPIIDFYNLQEEVVTISALFANNAFSAVFVSAFTPIPYKVFTLTAGFLRIDFVTFVVASIIGRGLRFYLVAYIFKRHGKTIGALLFKYFNYIGLFFGLFIILYIVFKFFF